MAVGDAKQKQQHVKNAHNAEGLGLPYNCWKSKGGSKAKINQSCEQEYADDCSHNENREEFHDFVNNVKSYILWL